MVNKVRLFLLRSILRGADPQSLSSRELVMLVDLLSGAMGSDSPGGTELVSRG